MNSEPQVKNIVLRDLQSLLRQSLGQTLIVENYTTKLLLPPGENYGSTILSVDATIRRDEHAEKENLQLIAKMSPPTEFQKQVFDSPFTFRKETFMYEDILPGYNQLEREAGLEDHEVFDILPKFYGSRLSMDPESDFDDDAAILLENLKAKGYYHGQRSIGYDLEHSKIAVRAMARFHALGMAMKYKKPEVFDVFRIRSKCFDFKAEEFKDIHDIVLRKIKDDPVTNPYYETCREHFANSSVAAAWTKPPNEPWSTIIHADFWVNNILFHRDEEGKVDDVKFVDFQNYLFFSPLRELIFYLFSSVNDEVHENHIDELIDLYHETFINVLTRMGCDTEPFSREKFDAQIPADANFEFFHLCFMLKVLTLDVDELNLDQSKIQNVMVVYEGNQLFVERLRRLVLYFADRKWI